jgi:hypothetical protein
VRRRATNAAIDLGRMIIQVSKGKNDVKWNGCDELGRASSTSASQMLLEYVCSRTDRSTSRLRLLIVIDTGRSRPLKPRIERRRPRRNVGIRHLASPSANTPAVSQTGTGAYSRGKTDTSHASRQRITGWSSSNSIGSQMYPEVTGFCGTLMSNMAIQASRRPATG